MKPVPKDPGHLGAEKKAKKAKLDFKPDEVVKKVKDAVDNVRAGVADIIQPKKAVPPQSQSSEDASNSAANMAPTAHSKINPSYSAQATNATATGASTSDNTATTTAAPANNAASTASTTSSATDTNSFTRVNHFPDSRDLHVEPYTITLKHSETTAKHPIHPET